MKRQVLPGKIDLGNKLLGELNSFNLLRKGSMMVFKTTAYLDRFYPVSSSVLAPHLVFHFDLISSVVFTPYSVEI